MIAVYPLTDLTPIKVFFCRGGSLQIIRINLSWCAQLRSSSMWCLGMPDCMAWGLYHSKARGTFSNQRAKSCSTSGARVLDVT